MRLLTDSAAAVITIFQEAEGENFATKLGVAEVIRNRRTRRFMSDGSVIGTVAKAYQFSGWNTKAPNRIRSLTIDDSLAVVQDCVRAWEKSAASKTVGDAVYFYAPKSMVPPGAVPDWAADKKPVARIQNTLFFEE